MATHLCRNSSAGIMAQLRMSKLLCRNYGRTFAAEIHSRVNYDSNPVPKFTHGGDFGKTSAAIIQNVDVSTAFLRTRHAQSFSQRRRSQLIQSLSAEFRHHFCHLPHILAFGILALVLTKFVYEL
jgi:hypothetical protein